MVKIEKSKDIRFKLTWFAFAALVFATSLCYFLGWAFEIKSFLIYLAIMVAELIALMILYVALIKFNKCYYLITTDTIKLFKSNQELFSLSINDITKIHYVRFVWTLLMQIGAGYLNIEYRGEIGNDKKYSTILSNGTKILSISMSLKQAKEISNMLGRKFI